MREVKEPKRKPTMREVARSCKVSPVTVSAVLNNKPGEVSDATRQRVLLAVREMGYRIPASQIPIEDRKASILGVVAGMAGRFIMKPGYYCSVFSNIVITASERGHNVLLYTNDSFHTDSKTTVRTYCDGRCDGVIVIAPYRNSDLVTTLRERGLPAVVIGTTIDDPSVPCVDIDNVAAARMATSYLFELGHRRVAIVGCGSGQPESHVPESMKLRQQGYDEAHQFCGIRIDPTLKINGGANDADVYDQVTMILHLPRPARPTAIFCWQDSAAYSAIKAAKDMGVDIPGELSIIGFNDDPDSLLSAPALTTVSQPYTQLAETAVNMLGAVMMDSGEMRMRVLLPAELVLRESVRAIV